MDSLTAESQQESLQAVLPLLEEGRHEEALPLIEESLGKSPMWSYLKALVLACLARGSEALPLLRESAKHPQFRIHFGLNSQLNTLIQTSALNHLLFETSVEPSDPNPWASLEEFARLLDNKEFLIKGYVAHLKVTPENQRVVGSLERILKSLPPEQALPPLEEIVEEQPDACRPRALLGHHLQRRGKTALAIRHLKTALDADPKAVEPHLYLGRIFVSQAKFEDAERELQTAIDIGEGPSAALLTEMANCQKATYRYEEALETLFSALDLDPLGFEAWEELTEVAQATGHGDRLQASVTRAVEAHPDNLNLRRRLILLCMSNGDPLAARSHLQSTGVFQDPTRDLVFARLAAELSMTLGQTKVATEILETALESQSSSPVLRLLYGQALERDQRPQEAEAVLRETAKHHPNDVELQIAWGKSLKACGELEKASRAFGLASRLDPEDAEAMSEQGLTLIAMGRGDEAQGMLKESAKKVEPPLSATLVGLGLLYEQRGMEEVARDFFRDALLGDTARRDAAEGWLRTRDSGVTLTEDCLELLARADTSFQKIQLYIAILRGAFSQDDIEQPRALRNEVYPQVLQAMKSEEYRRYLESSEWRMLPLLAQELEREGELEKARQLWRYAVSSGQAELSQQATSELKRLDTYEGPAVEEESEPQAAPSSEPAEGDGDALMSLLSSTIPTPTQPQEEAPLFASDAPAGQPAAEASLFHSESEPEASSSDDSGLFAEPELVSAAATSTPEPPPPAEDDGDLFAEPSSGEPVAESVAPEASPEPVSPPVAETAAVEQPGVEAPASEPVASSVAPEATGEQVAPVVGTAAPEQPAALDAPEGEPAPAEETTPAAAPLTEAPVAETAAVEQPAPAAVQEEAPAQPPSGEETTPAVSEAPSETAALEQSAPAAVQEEAPAQPSSVEETTPTVSGTPSEADAPAVTDAAVLEQPVQPEAQEEVPAAPSTSVQESTPAASEPVTEETPAAEPVVETEDDTDLEEGSLFPSTEMEALPSQPAAAVPEERKELLPIPMPADFQPLTRRQLHYHEVLTQSAASVVDTESVAHILLQSSLTHEPPDPGSEAGPTSSTDSIQQALLAGAYHLEQAHQYRGAARVLKTALLYNPSKESILEALARVQGIWANWLVQRHEYAHAISLVRDTLQRQPQLESAATHLEQIYHNWMEWCEQAKDPAARSLLAVYLEQEKAALGDLRQEWKERQARAVAPQPPAQAAPPPVAPQMPAAQPVAATSETSVPATGMLAQHPGSQESSQPETPEPPVPHAEPVATVAATVEEEPVVAADPAPAEPAAQAPPAEEPPAPATTPEATAPAAQAEPAASEPETPVPEPEPAPAAAEPQPAPAAESTAIPSFGSAEEALAALEADPTSQETAEALFGFYSDNMRDLTTLLREKVSSDGDTPEWLLYLARAFRRSGSETMAVIQYQKYIKADPSPAAYEELAQTYEQIGKEDFASMTRRKAERAFS